MKAVWLYALAVVALLLLAFVAYLVAPGGGGARVELDQSRTRSTAKGLYVATIAPESADIKQGEMQAWIFTLKTKEGQPVDDARIKVDGGMPEHNHGLPTAPEMTARLGEGRYRIEGIKFSMGGWWELRFAISAAGGDDAVTFNLVL